MTTAITPDAGAEIEAIVSSESRPRAQVLRLLLEDALVSYRRRGRLATRRRAASPARAAKVSVEASNA